MLRLLHTPRLVLRPAISSDVDALWRLWRDPEVRRFLWDDRAIEHGEAAQLVEDLLALAPKGLGLWVIERVDGPESLAFAGCAALIPVSTAAEHEPAIAGMVEPLVALVPALWGRLYAAETLDALVSYAFETLALPALAGVTDIPNAASDRMLRRAGFVPYSEVDGPTYPMRTYRLERSQATASSPTG